MSRMVSREEEREDKFGHEVVQCEKPDSRHGGRESERENQFGTCED
jgi:hypothetical protein